MAFHSLQFNKGNLTRLITNVTGVVNTWSAGATGLTPAGASSGNVVLAGTLAVANGGTGVTTSTGGGSVVLNTSATLVTPVIGVATGTSLVLAGNIETATYAIIGRNLSPTAGGSTAYAANFFNATAIGIYTGTGSPTISTARGSLYLRNDGLPYYNTNGTTGWSPIAGVTQTKITVFISSGTWFVDPRTLEAQMECWGGGGGGGGTAGNVGTVAAGGGGGAGSYSRTTSLKATIGTSQTVTIGALGGGGSAGANPGTGGGDTSVGSLCIGKGGSGGGGNAGGVNSTAAGGLGGIAGTGDITSTGAPGSSSGATTTSGVGDVTGQGFGGSSSVGGGGRGPLQVSTGTVAGEAGTGHGSGGGAGGTASSSSTVGGGNGTSGYAVITEYLAA